MKNIIFTIAYNRLSFLRLSMASVLSQAEDTTYVVWDNASNPETKAAVNSMRLAIPNPTVNVIYVPSENIGLNAAQKIVSQFKSENTKYIMSLDEDVLMLPLKFQTHLQAYLDAGIGYVALDVFQDKTTNGAKPPLNHYRQTIVGTASGEYPLLEGPTGGWGSMVTSEVYDLVGGYPVRDELFFGLDGIFSESIRKAGKRSGIAEGLYCYHATGNDWNQGLGYSEVLNQKLESYKLWLKAGSP